MGLQLAKLPGNLQLHTCAAQGSLPSGLGTASPSFQPDQKKEQKKTKEYEHELCSYQGPGDARNERARVEQMVNPPELLVGPAHCSFQWFWALYLPKKEVLKLLSTCCRLHVTSIRLTLAVACKGCHWQWNNMLYFEGVIPQPSHFNIVLKDKMLKNRYISSCTWTIC